MSSITDYVPPRPARLEITIDRLTCLGVPARLLQLANLTHGPALAERARIRRYEILTDACREAGVLHLLLGHHAADQAETLAMRVLRGSRTHGLAGMPALRETAGVRLLRPLLGIEPALLRDFLSASAINWIEDPSNRDARALRPRLRQRIAASVRVDTGLERAISAVARLRAREEAAIGAELASRAILRPEGFALLSSGRIGSPALSSLVPNNRRFDLQSESSPDQSTSPRSRDLRPWQGCESCKRAGSAMAC